MSKIGCINVSGIAGIPWKIEISFTSDWDFYKGPHRYLAHLRREIYEYDDAIKFGHSASPAIDHMRVPLRERARRWIEEDGPEPCGFVHTEPSFRNWGGGDSFRAAVEDLRSKIRDDLPERDIVLNLVDSLLEMWRQTGDGKQ